MGLEILRVTDEGMLSECLKIREEVFTGEKNVPKDIEVDGLDVINGRCTHFLIKADGGNAGTLRCLELSGDTVRLQRFCFLRKYRGQGLGRLTLQYIENCYKNRSRIVLDAQIDASGFYERCGYEKVSDVFMEAGIPHIKMMKNINRRT